MMFDNKTDDPFSTLTAEDMRTKQEIFGKILTLLDLSVLETMENKAAKAQITDLCCSLLNELTRPLNLKVRQILIKLIIDEILGLGPLETLLEDASIADILVNRFDSIYVERSGKLEKSGRTILR